MDNNFGEKDKKKNHIRDLSERIVLTVRYQGLHKSNLI